jgi:NPCBM/NEW2 domain
MDLDLLSPVHTNVGYGQLGTGGGLEYEGKQVSVQGRSYRRALSSHPPARLLSQLDARFSAFRCQVALNDDVRSGASYAHFAVVADGREVAIAPSVVAGDTLRTLQTDFTDARFLEWPVRTGRWECCHAVWLDPQLDEAAAATPSSLVDCLGRAVIAVPQALPSVERCIAMTVSPGYEVLVAPCSGRFTRMADVRMLCWLFSFSELTRAARSSQPSVARPSSIARDGHASMRPARPCCTRWHGSSMRSSSCVSTPTC